jgi:hypothetical protein
VCCSVDAQPKWKKILYAPQPYEDNYVDETFLEQMRTNGALALQIAWGSACMATQLNAAGGTL